MGESVLEAKKGGWTVIRMKTGLQRIFPFERQRARSRL
jgi:hypothetical protein